MSNPPILGNLLAFKPMPELGAALRKRKSSIVSRWTTTVHQVLPDASPLTRDEVRDTIPLIIDHMVRALQSDDPKLVRELADFTKNHGKVRFDQDYDVAEFLAEYRLLIQIVLAEVGEELGGSFSVEQISALSTALEIAVHQGTINFVSFLAQRLRSAAEGEIRFLSFLSHDLRNNLNVMMLTLELLSERLRKMPEMEQEAQDLDSAQRAARTTIEGMERLLQAERMRNRSEAPRRQPVDLNRLFNEILSEHVRQAEEKSLDLEAVAPDNATLQSDAEILSIILRNLVGNAVKYSTRGLVRVEATPPASLTEGWIITVSDQGPGISNEHQDRLFQAFRRGETYGQKGIGLGLAIAFQSARLLGAQLSVKSVVGQGSAFSLHFRPLEPPRA